MTPSARHKSRRLDLLFRDLREIDRFRYSPHNWAQRAKWTPSVPLTSVIGERPLRRKRERERKEAGDQRYLIIINFCYCVNLRVRERIGKKKTDTGSPDDLMVSLNMDLPVGALTRRSSRRSKSCGNSSQLPLNGGKEKDRGRENDVAAINVQNKRAADRF
ncbi:hypothetical protein PUN28_007821 [Cardiocondyla obscurior]|uniref:Uncharacterized protein n=1 Tax=Cardiocondyla obscurior TaxID=286306 RepID=A0AAW2FWR6_9HYME